MVAFAHEWLNLLVRWVHVIAAIMWIGDSFLFMWMDSHLSAPLKQREGEVVGELWLTHSGGFYEVIKRKSLRRDELPPKLYWFKWESYTTWITGVLLLIIVFYANGSALLVDPAVYPLQGFQAAAISFGLLPLAYGLYELLWKTPLKGNQGAFAVVGLAIITGLAYALTRVFSARGAYLQVGATLGTVMTANVFFRIIPAQRHMMAATKAGQPVDVSYGVRAKGRSIQNHYLTLPVLFSMLSNHFPSTYGARQPWLVLGLLFILGVGLKYAMNKRATTPPAALGGTLVSLGAVVFLTRPPPDATLLAYEGKPHVSFATVSTIVEARCTNCHAQRPSSPMFAAPPQGVMLDTPEGIKAHADRMFVRAVSTKTMPLGNLTGITQDERDFLGAWFAQGADTKAEGPSQIGEDKSREYFAQVCVPCHGAEGRGNGSAAADMNPKPRDFHDAEWQKSVADDRLRTIILKGGQAVGKSSVMPENPALEKDRPTLDGLVKQIRAFGGKP